MVIYYNSKDDKSAFKIFIYFLILTLKLLNYEALQIQERFLFKYIHPCCRNYI